MAIETTLPVFVDYLLFLLAQAIEIWISGGWAMIGIAAIAVVMFWFGLHVRFKLLGLGFLALREKTWRRWLDYPEEAEGPIGEVIQFVSGARSVEDATLFFEELNQTQISPYERDLRVMKVCITAAPLVGLLGTVTGMLATFAALSSGSGGEETMKMVAAGISEALITTETGLVIALSGLFLHYQPVRKLNRYKAFLAHLETVVTQNLYRELNTEPTSIEIGARVKPVDRRERKIPSIQLQEPAEVPAAS